MALINCPECGKEMSDKVIACPHCGYPIGQGEVDVGVIGFAPKAENRKPRISNKLVSLGVSIVVFLLAVVAFFVFDHFGLDITKSDKFNSELEARISKGADLSEISYVVSGNYGEQFLIKWKNTSLAEMSQGNLFGIPLTYMFISALCTSSDDVRTELLYSYEEEGLLDHIKVQRLVNLKPSCIVIDTTDKYEYLYDKFGDPIYKINGKNTEIPIFEP